jgi:uncharacterized protein (TIGR02246 family)
LQFTLYSLNSRFDFSGGNVMRMFILLSGAALLAAIIQLSVSGRRPPELSQRPFEAVTASALGEMSKLPARSPRGGDSEPAAPQIPDPLGTVLGGRDRQEIATHLTPTAEFVDRKGHVFRGRESIAHELEAVFSQAPAGQTAAQMDSLRIVESGVVIEDGFTTKVQAGEESPIRTRYTAVEVRHDGKWYVASVRERPWTKSP